MRRRARWCVAAIALAALAGCGDRRLVLDVDVLSYIDPAYTSATFGPVIAVPGGLAPGEQAVVSNQSVNLLEGLPDAIEIESVSFSLGAVFVDSTGSGSDTLRVYLAGPNDDPLSAPPVIEQAVTLTAGATDTLALNVDGDARVRSLFQDRSMRLTFTTSLRGPDSGASLTGRYALTRLHATVIGGRAAW